MIDKNPHLADALANAIVLIISALGLMMEPHEFVAGIFMSMAGSAGLRIMMPDAKHRAIWLTLAMGITLGVVGMMVTQAMPQYGVSPQLAAFAGGVASVLVLPWLARRFPSLADSAADKFIGAKEAPDKKEPPQ